MKTTLFTVALLASQWCAGQRIREITNGSWNHPDLSVETQGNFVISGFTEVNPATGRLAPTFKINNPVGGAVAAYHINYPDPVYLMDFYVRQNTNTLVFVGMVDDVGATPYKMVVAEWNYLANVMVQNTLQNFPANLIPHQVIVSETSQQAVLVGSRINGTITAANFSTLPKSGFVLSLNLANFLAVNYAIETNTPTTGTSDNDILESITEIPNNGYFLGGSANGAANEQNVHLMGVSYTGGILHTRVFDNTNFRGAAASVLFSTMTAPACVYAMVNSSSMHQFQLARFDPLTGAPMSATWLSHQITTMPIGGGVDQNGFRLAQNPAASQLFVAGYLSAPGGALPQLLTPFQMTLTPLLGYTSGKHFLSGNNAPLTGYFEERGNSVYINTPDILAFHASNRNYLVSPNSVNTGFDLFVTAPSGAGGCERPLTTTPVTQPIVAVGSASFASLAISPSVYAPAPAVRAVSQATLCQQAAAAAPAPVLWPNPANNELNLSLGNGSTIQSAIIYDLNGKVVLEVPAYARAREEISLDIAHLTNGLYLIGITDTDGTVSRLTFVKE